VWNTAFRSLTFEVSLGTDNPALVEPLRALTASYATAGPGTPLRYWLETNPVPRLFRDGEEVVRAETSIDLVPLFELDLYQEVGARAAGGCLLHAACIAVDDRAMLLVGPSGAGKSTLALTLLGEGGRYLGDEYVLLTAEGAVQGLTRPITFSSAPSGLPPSFSIATVCYRAPAGGLASATLVHPPSDQLEHGTCLCHRLALIGHDAVSTPGSRRLRPGEALAELWPHVFNPSARALDALLSSLAHAEAYVVQTHTVEQASELLRRVRS
jgi:hypothetical protein